LLPNMLRKISFLICIATLFSCKSPGIPEEVSLYYPEPGVWEKRDAAFMGFDAIKLEKAISFGLENQTQGPINLEAMLRSRARTVYDSLVGPTKERGEFNVLVIKNGYIIYELGDTKRVDMTFSVTKSFLSTVIGLAFDQGLIMDLDDKVISYGLDSMFQGEHNSQITWNHLLTQTSEWEGWLWGKPDLADRRKGVDRELQTPGTFWEYNDVRVNLASFVTMNVHQKPLPEVLKKKIMDPIGATDTWQWHGYRTSEVIMNGRSVTSVSGGGHWGGGMWISTRDLARFGLLFLRNGIWKDQPLISFEWINKATTPSAPEPIYGYMWWLNTESKMWPNVPADSYAARGGGSNIVWIYPEIELVVVVRWIDGSKVNELFSLITGSYTGSD